MGRRNAAFQTKRGTGSSHGRLPRCCFDDVLHPACKTDLSSSVLHASWSFTRDSTAHVAHVEVPPPNHNPCPAKVLPTTGGAVSITRRYIYYRLRAPVKKVGVVFVWEFVCNVVPAKTWSSLPKLSTRIATRQRSCGDMQNTDHTWGPSVQRAGRVRSS